MKLIHGDCLEKMKNIQDKSIDLVLTDPPYMISRETNFSKGGGDKAKYGSLSMDFGEWDKGEGIDMKVFFREAYRVLAKGGTFIMFYDIFKMESIRNIAESVGFKQPRIGFWNKTNAVPLNARINYLSNAREYFICFCKGKKGVFHSYYDKGTYDYPIVSGKERNHPTQKPVSLMRDLILTHSNEGDVILDPFMGSGTTGVACINTKRDFIGIELNEEYFRIAEKRINDAIIEKRK